MSKRSESQSPGREPLFQCLATLIWIILFAVTTAAAEEVWPQPWPHTVDPGPPVAEPTTPLARVANNEIEYLGSCLWTGVSYTVIDGHHAYCALVNGLVILDISDLANPEELSHLYTDGYAGKLTKVGNFVYLANGPAGLAIADVTDPANPVLVGSCGAPDFTYDVFVHNSFAYVAAGDSGLKIIDVSNPAVPVTTGSYQVPCWTNAVFVQDSLAFVLDWNSYLQVVNVSDPTTPVLLGGYDAPGYPYDLFVQDGLAFVVDNFGLQIIDVSNPVNPDSVSS